MHSEETKIAILGLGHTLRYYDGWSPSIGVNDIWRHYETDYVVTMDHKSVFAPDRLEVMEQCQPAKFFYYDRCGDWRYNHNADAINTLAWTPERQFKIERVYHSTNTPFVACSIAAKLGFKDLVLYGVDFIDHKKINHPNHLGVLEKTVRDFKELNAALKQEGVTMYVAHRYSELSRFLPLWR